MTAELSKIFGFSILGIMLLLPLKELKKEHYTVGIITVSVSLMLVILKKSIPLFEYVKNIVQGEFSGYCGIAFTAFGIAVITNLISEMCHDFGASSISGKIEFAGRVAVMTAALPLVEALISMMEEML